jgi:hypothetical protein
VFNNDQFITGATATNISYDSNLDETYFRIPVDRINNPFDIDYSISASTNLSVREIVVSPYRNLYNTYLDYCVAINDNIYKNFSNYPNSEFLFKKYEKNHQKERVKISGNKKY